MSKCPYCGKDLSKPFDYNTQLVNLLYNTEPSLRAKIELVADRIMREIPGENSSEKYYNLLLTVQNIPANIVIEGLQSYVNSNAFSQGKGFAYLSHIIKSWSIKRNKVIENQRKVYGESPPTKELK